MIPHERSLVMRMEGRPFVLIGVNSDADREELKTILQKEQITWRSFWDGGSTEGPIATTWNVIGWPTIYILDHKGVIRAIQLREKALDEMVDKLVQEAEVSGGCSSPSIGHHDSRGIK